MKTQKMIYLDVDLVQKIQDKKLNLSALVSELLENYFFNNKLNDLSIEQIEKVKEIHLQEIQLRKEREEIMNGRSNIN